MSNLFYDKESATCAMRLHSLLRGGARGWGIATRSNEAQFRPNGESTVARKEWLFTPVNGILGHGLLTSKSPILVRHANKFAICHNNKAGCISVEMQPAS